MQALEDLLHKDGKIKLEGEGRSVIAQVDALDSASLAVRRQEKGSDLLAFKIGARIQGTFLKDGTVCSFDTHVIGKEASPPRLVLSRPKHLVQENVKCYQRSGFTGIEGFIPFRYARVVRGQAVPAGELELSETGVATWIGGNELTMASVEEIPRGTLLALEFRKPVSDVPIRIFGKVGKARDHGSLFHLRVSFEAMNENNRDIILRYCLRKQAELNKNGLLTSPDRS